MIRTWFYKLDISTAVQTLDLREGTDILNVIHRDNYIYLIVLEDTDNAIETRKLIVAPLGYIIDQVNIKYIGSAPLQSVSYNLYNVFEIL